MKLLIILLLYFLLFSCARPNECYISVDINAAIEAGEDCKSIAYCSNGRIDESVLKHCLAEKKKKENQKKEVKFFI